MPVTRQLDREPSEPPAEQARERLVEKVAAIYGAVHCGPILALIAILTKQSSQNQHAQHTLHRHL
jgi:hypothetical protein